MMQDDFKYCHGFKCGLCGIDYQHVGSWRCVECSYDVCSECFEKRKANSKVKLTPDDKFYNEFEKQMLDTSSVVEMEAICHII